MPCFPCTVHNGDTRSVFRGRLARPPPCSCRLCNPYDYSCPTFAKGVTSQRALTQSNVSTVRATSPAFIARKASLMSERRPRLVTMRVEVEPALAVEIEIERDVVAKPVRAHARGLYLAFRPDRHPWELDHRVGRQHADDRRGAADRQALDRLPHQLGEAHRLESVVDAEPAGQCPHRLNRVVLGAVDKMGRAGAGRHLALRFRTGRRR